MRVDTVARASRPVTAQIGLSAPRRDDVAVPPGIGERPPAKLLGRAPGVGTSPLAALARADAQLLGTTGEDDATGAVPGAIDPRWALLGLTASQGRAAACLGDAEVNPTTPTDADLRAARNGRPLTAGEVTLARAIFGNTLDPARVRIYARKYNAWQPDSGVMTPDGNSYYSEALYRTDFADPRLALIYTKVFVHELVHAWQHQAGVNVKRKGFEAQLSGWFVPRRVYDVDLKPGRDLTRYNVEHQAEIVTRYFLPSIGDEKNLPQYEEALGRFVADPAYYAEEVSTTERRHREQRQHRRRRHRLDD